MLWSGQVRLDLPWVNLSGLPRLLLVILFGMTLGAPQVQAHHRHETNRQHCYEHFSYPSLK